MEFSANPIDNHDRLDPDSGESPPNHPLIQVIPHECFAHGKNRRKKHGGQRRCWRRACPTILTPYNAGKLGRTLRGALALAFGKGAAKEIVLCVAHQREANLAISSEDTQEQARWFKIHLCRPAAANHLHLAS